MKKIKKILFISLILWFVTGCDATYNVEIYNDSYKEDGTIVENNPQNWDDDSSGFTPRELIHNEYKLDNYFYNKTLIDDNTSLGLNYKSNFDFESFSTNSLGFRCYEYFRALDENNSIIIMTSNKNLCYDRYKWLDNLTINVKTNHKVLEHNADAVNKDTYTWHLTRQNALDRIVKIELAKDEYVSNYDNEILKNAGIIIGVIIGGAILTIVIVFFFRKRMDTANKV